MNSLLLVYIIIAVVAVCTNGYINNNIRLGASSILRKPLYVSDVEREAIDAIKAKMAADPNYNPMSDPQAVAALDSLIPAEIKDLASATERLKVAFKDATEGVDAIADLDAATQGFERKDLISSPQSEWFKSGYPADTEAFSESKKEEYKNAVKAKYPSVPEKAN